MNIVDKNLRGCQPFQYIKSDANERGRESPQNVDNF
jgi:hypothetical protein